jgi:hypothetical protein
VIELAKQICNHLLLLSATRVLNKTHKSIPTLFVSDDDSENPSIPHDAMTTAAAIKAKPCSVFCCDHSKPYPSSVCSGLL